MLNYQGNIKPSYKLTIRYFQAFRIAASLIALWLVSCLVLWGQVNGDYRTRATGSWNTGNTWQVYNGGWNNCAAGDYPGATSGAGTVTIQNNHIVTLNVSPAYSIGSIDIPGGNQDSWITFSGAYTLNVTEATSISSNSNGDWKAILVNTGTFTTSSISLSSGNNDNQDAYIEISTGTVNVSGNISMNNTNARTYIRFSGSGTLNVGGTITGGGITSASGGGATAPTSGTVNYNNNGIQNVGGYTYYNLTISNSGTKTLSNNIGVNNNLGITGSAVLASDVYTITGNATGTFTMAAGTGLTLGNTGDATAVAFPSNFTAGNITLNNTSTITYQSTGAQTVSNVPTYGNLTLATSGTKTLQGAITVNNNLAVNGSATLASDIYQITGGTGTCNMAAGAGFTLGRTDNATAVTFPTFATATSLDVASTVTYQTNGMQQVASLIYGNLTIAGGDAKVLQGSAAVAGVLSLTSGILQLGDYDLTISNSSSSAITGTFSGTNMIEINGLGSLIKQGAAQDDFEMVYPVGTGSSYTPMEIRELAVTGITNPGSISVSTVASSAAGIPGLTPLNRYWVTSSNNLTGTIVADISFTYVSADVPVGADPDEYYIYYKPVFTGTWEVPGGPAPHGSNPFYASLASTLDATWSVSIPEKKVFYSMITGNWDDWETWTLDPSGALMDNPGNYTPTTSPTAAFDDVVILSGRTVTVASDSLGNGSLTVNGRLDLTTTTGHSFISIDGSGRILLAADNFPDGDATHFITGGLGEGTVVYYGNSYDLTTARTFYDVEINPTAGDTVRLAADYVINGNLTLKTGIFQINDGTATARTLVINGDLNVDNGASFAVGNGNAIHSIELYGNVLNNGSIDLANDVQYDYPSTGAAKIYFYGASDNTLHCGGTTDLYRLFLDKGTDETYTLSVTSSNTNNFRLFGPVSGSTVEPSDGPGGWERLALVLIHGTLKLSSNINIPILGDDRAGASPNEFHISYGTQLWINGATVSTHTSGGGWRGITIYGTLRVSSGTFTNPDGTGGITYFGNIGQPGKLLLEGGAVYTTQIKQADVNGRFSYIQTGGTLYINNLSDSRGSSAVFALPTSDFVFYMSGGLIQIDAVNTTATNGIHIACDPMNVSVTGGTFDIQTPTLDAAGQPDFYINSTIPFYNLTLTNSGRGGPQDVTLQSALTVLNNLTIGSNTSFNANGYDVTVYGNMSISGTYIPVSNTTIFDGSGSSTFTNSGTISPALHNWTVNKPGATLTLAGTGSFTCANLLTLTSGTLDDGGKTITINKDISNYAVHASTVAGRILLSGGSSQHIISGSGSGQFGNFEVDDGNGASLSADQQINDTLFMTNGILDLGVNKLNLAGALSPDNITGYSTTKMIRMAGNDSDDGLVRTVSGNGSVYFPIGTNANAINRYTPAIAILSSVSDTGILQMNVADKEIPSLVQPPGNALTYYWRVRNDGFASTPTVTYQFSGVDNDDYDGGATPAGYNTAVVPGKALNVSPYTRSSESTTDISGFVITFDGAGAGFPLETASYTAGLPAKFVGSPTEFYTNAWYGVWTDPTIWHQGAKAGPTGTVPTAGSIVHIYSDVTNPPSPGQGRITVDATGIPNAPAEINFDHNYIVNPVANSENVPRLQFYNGPLTCNLGNVKGTGMISFGATGITLNGDFGDFGTNPDSYYLLFGGPASVSNIPTPIPNLMIEYTTSINQNITVNNDLIIQGGATVTPLQDIYVKNDLLIGYWSGANFRFPGATGPLTITVDGNVDYTQDPLGVLGTRSITVQATATAIEHRFIVKGDILHGSVNTWLLDLYNAVNQTKVILELAGTGNNSYSRTSTSVPDLYRLEMNKGSDQTSSFIFNQHFTLNGATDGSPKALELLNGTLILNNASFNIPLTTGGAYFSIPSTSALEVRAGTVTATGGSGIGLDGLLLVSGGTVDMTGGDNYIEYSASGNARITVTDGTLTVGSQIRRSQYITEGVLGYNQSGGTVTVGRSIAPVNSRGVFEILNTGSDFTYTGGTLAISRAQTTPAVPSFCLDPETSNIGTGMVINFGDVNTPAGQNIGVYSTVPLQTLAVNSTNSPTARMWTGPLTLDGNLNINASASFNANGLDLILNGDLTNSGTFQANSNTTYFSGTSDQTITGNTTFYNLTKNTSNDLQLAAGSTQVDIDNVLNVENGTFTDNSNEIFIKGYVNFEGTHVYGGSGNGIILDGSMQQQLTGDGVFGKLTIDNSNDVDVPEGNSITINNALRLDGAVFNIGKNLLTLALNASIEEPTPFSSGNMIQTNVSFTDVGVKKVLPAGASSFLYPIGSGGKYTPVTLNITGNGNSTGSITVKAANEIHPSIVDDSEAPDPEIVDMDNALQYYWVLSGSGITGFSATADMEYEPTDIAYTPPYDITDYITARLLSDGSGLWNKFYDETTVDEANNKLIFTFAGTDDFGISGDYTAGVDGLTFQGAIPDLVATYETNSSGSWTTGTIWTPNVAGGPRGSITVINFGHSVTVPSNYISNYSITINGNLLVNSTYGHRLGIVDGTGLLYSERGELPAGVYNNFFSSGGGTIEFGGNSDYDVLGGQAFVNHLKFSGTEDRRLPNSNLLINGDLIIDGEGTLNVINEYDKEIEIKGDLILTGGNFDAGTGATASVLFSSYVNQSISGDFTGTNMLNLLEIDNVNGVTLSGDVEVKSELKLTAGAITIGSNTFTLGLSATISPSSGTSTRYVNGELTKVLTASSDFTYPIGKDGHLGTMELIGVTGFSGSDNWVAEYFFTAPFSYDSYAAPINYVSHTEYWSIQGPAGGSSNLKINLDGSSDVANAITDLADLRFVGWDASQSRWELVGGTPSVTGTATSGTITTGSAIDFDTYQYITLASIQAITLATASMISGDATICNGLSTDIIVSLTGTPNWSYTYTDGTTPVAVTGVTTTSDTITVSPSSTTIYTLMSVSDDNGAGILVGDTNVVITVNFSPTATFSNNSTGDEICSGTSVIFTAGGGTNFDFHVNNTSIQNGAGTTYTTSALADQDEIFVVVSISSGCSDTSSTTIMTVNPLPAGTLTSDDADNIICYGDTVIFTATGGTNYRFMVDGSTVQDGSTATYETVSLTDGDIVTVEVTNAASCSSIYAGIAMTVNPLPTVDLGTDMILCVDSSAVLDAGAGMTGYAWSTTETTQTITVSIAGEYSVTVNDINSCVNSDTIQVDINPMTINRVITNATCNGYADGAIDITVSGGNLPIAGYLWSNSETTQDITGLTAGSYTVTVTDAQGCPLDSTFTVTEPPPVVPTITGSDSICQETIVIYTTEAGMNNYSWIVTDVDPTAAHTVIAGGGASDNTIQVQWDGYEIHIVSVNYEDGTGCSASSPTELEIWVTKLPETGPEYHLPNSP